ncbi:signal transduction histidine kinase [Desulfobaculum xiamenense]|uniref:histidine kinase n=1 Tax=Desulfobaculum xiamenense TaxID=995050 RepID=A0A846QK91_9BACT|nr:ATP-binding protein [Desulfobaculum xiamenense]NJB69336.1 signal transduction histidine kinase [Desulfobaculum xiamenense]
MSKDRNRACPAPEDWADAGESGSEIVRRIRTRILRKVCDYSRYEFEASKSSALNIFFDLVQEFERESDFHAVCVSVPKVIFGLDASLYLLSPESVLRCVHSTAPSASPPFDGDALPSEPVDVNGRFCCPIRGNHRFIDQLPFVPRDDVIGYIEIRHGGTFTDRDRLFWEKFANRIGFQQHLRMIHGANRRHLAFIRNLVKDIGHNVIVPNMYFKLFFGRLKRSIDTLGALCDEGGEALTRPLGESCDDLRELHAQLEAQYLEIARHYEQTSLYLETLLRQSHFEKGRYVLERRPCHLPLRIIEPQLVQHESRFQDRAITVVPGLRDVPDHRLEVQVDVGLMAQVFSNLFSNAAKYAAVGDGEAAAGRQISVGWELLPHFFEATGEDGLCVAVGSSGPAVNPADVPKLFDPGFRGSNAGEAEGSGHGLFFVRQIVELHGGVVGYRRRGGMNEFYMVLPIGNGEGSSM